MARLPSWPAARPLRFFPALGLLVLMALSLPIAGCSSNGSECDTCSVDADCDTGLVCSTFLNDDGTVNSKRCGTGRGSLCRVR